MRNLRAIAGVTLLSLALAVVGCGQADESGSVTITSVPQAEVFVDGVSHGASGQTLLLPAGKHDIEFRAEGFKPFETTAALTSGETKAMEAVLEPLDPSSPAVVASLLESEGLEVAPWVAPEVTRGRSGKQAVAVLLWPSKDVRLDGLVSFAIEADESYGGDASLEFRSDGKVLYREAFNPASITSVRPLPAEVIEHAKVNSQITWGLYFEDRRHPINTTFKVVNRPNAEKQLDRLRTSRHMQRQPQITREIAAAVVLENNRLYSEALVANLTIANEHPESTQPYRGIITTLRRLDAENSELFATISPHVSGKGARGTMVREGGLGIVAWSPTQAGAIPAPTATAAAGTPARPSTPGGMGVTPSGGTTDTPDGAEPTPSAGGTATPTDGAEVLRLRTELEQAGNHRTEARREFDRLQNEAARAAETAAEAEQAAREAEAAAQAARAEIDGTAEPTPEQLAARDEADRAAEAARAAADEAAPLAEASAERARAQALEVERLNARVRDAQHALDTVGTPTAPAAPTQRPHPGASLPSPSELRAAFDAAQGRLDSASAAAETAAAALTQAESAHDANPTPETRDALQAAQESSAQADAALDQARRALDAARRAVDQAAGGAPAPVDHKATGK